METDEVRSREKSPMAMTHNISISVTDTDSPGVRRRSHLRSLSDVTPGSCAGAGRPRSQSERPRAATSPAHSPAPPRALSARCSPHASRDSLARPRPDRALTLHADPWRKMSDVDLARREPAAPSAAPHDPDRAYDPWVKHGSRGRGGGGEATGETVRRGKLERLAAVVCEQCGHSSCECWRRCTCEAPRPSPARLGARRPARALSDEDARPRRLYKSASQKLICSSTEREPAPEPADPLLETTC